MSYLASARTWMRAHHAHLSGTALLLAIIAFAVFASWRGTGLDDFTMDEPWHINSGVQHVRYSAFHVNAEQPPLVKEWVGLAMPETYKSPEFRALNDKIDERDFHETAVFLDNDPEAVQARARAAMWTFHALMLLALGLLLWRVFNLAWSAGTLAFLALEPGVAANLPLVMQDFPVAITLAITVLCTGLAISTWRWRWFVAMGVAAGAALGCKFSAPVALIGIAIVALIAVVVRGRKYGLPDAARQLGKLVSAGAVAITILWGLYGFQYHATPDGTDPFNRELSAKIDDLQSARHRSLLHTIDDAHLLPRSYIWGQADTLWRTEGDWPYHFFFGTLHVGDPPVYFWPGLLVAKIPLALLALTLLGIACLRRPAASPDARWSLYVLAGMTALFGAALLISKSTYAGYRIALPLVLVFAICAGAAFSRAWAARAALPKIRWSWFASVGVLVLIAAVTEASEPRLLEYHNVLAGGTEGAYRNFKNDGVDIQQRSKEIRHLYEKEIAATGLPLYDDYEILEAEAKLIPTRRHFVESIYDTNVEGVFEGYFVFHMYRRLAMQPYGMDPEIWPQLQEVKRLGNATVWKGRARLPRMRAKQVLRRVRENVYATDAPDWKTVRVRLEETMPWFGVELRSAGVILGNACQKLADRECAIKAFTAALTRYPEEDIRRPELVKQIERLKAGEDLANLPMIRDPALE